MKTSGGFPFGDLLRGFRTRARMSQTVLAEKLGVTRLTISNWEEGNNLPRRRQVKEIADALLLDEEDTNKLMAASLRQIPVRRWNVPYRRNGFFTGRQEVLGQLRAVLTTSAHSIAISQPQAISGLGGIGKTQLAVEYAYRHRDDYSAILWASAESADVLVSDFSLIAALLELEERHAQEQSTMVNAVLRWFDTHQGWLLILDNANDLEIARPFIPSSGNGHVLLTTRAFSTGTIAERIELETIPVEEGVLFLLRRSKYIQGKASLESVSASIRSQARAIVEAMGALPLALDQAGAYIEENQVSLSDYLQLYTGRRRQLLRERGQDAAGHPEPVATTWSLSFERIKQANPAAAELLYLFALLHPDRIPEPMIIAGASKLGPVLQSVVQEEVDFNQAIRELLKYSLVKRNPEEKSLVIHQLVQAVIWDSMEEHEREHWREQTVSVLNAVFPEVTQEAWEACERLVPHVLTCAQAVLAEQTNLELAALLRKTAVYLFERAQYMQAEPLFRRALHIREQALGTEHHLVATPLNWLAELYREQGKYEQAEPLYQRALHIWEQTLGPEHDLVASPLNGLAIIYNEQGKYEQAEPLYWRAIHILEQALGPDNPKVAWPLTNLAILYKDQSKYEQAEPLHQRALSIREQALGPEHPDVAYSLTNLATLYQEQGKYELAELLLQRALHIREQALGPEHPQVAYPLTNLAELYREQGQDAQAEPLYRRALSIWEQALGPEHPDVAYPLNGLANLAQNQGKYEQASQLYQRALTIRQHHRGAQHPETAESLHDLAHFYEVRGQSEQALPLYRQALAIREQRLGSQHPRTVDTRARIARLVGESDQ